MLVIMQTDASPEEVQGVMSRLKEANLEGHLSAGEERTVIGAVGRVIDPEIRTAIGTMSGVEQVVAISRPYKLSGREFKPADTIHRRGRRAHRRRQLRRHGRPVQHRERGAHGHDRARGQGGRGPHPARRRIQAPHVAVLVPRPGRGGSQAPGDGPRGDGPARHHRGDVDRRRRDRRPLRRHPADRRAQHAELQPARRGGPGAQAGHAQARPQRHHRGVAAGRRVHHGQGQPRGHPLPSAASAPSRPPPATPSTSRRWRWSSA